MILTCPACATQYRLKDDAIPPEGRTVRCAACKHKWHEQGSESPGLPGGETDEPAAGGNTGASAQRLIDDEASGIGIAPPPPQSTFTGEGVADVPADARDDEMIAGEPQPSIAETMPTPGEPLPSPTEINFEAATSDPNSYAPVAPYADGGQWSPRADTSPAADEQDFSAIGAIHEDDEPPRRRVWGWILGIILIVVAAAAAFYFLAPPELKARAGITEAGESPLQLMLTTSDRQRLASGNELLAISGRVINATDREQAVPPIHAELRNPTTNELVYKWTIAPPARSLAPGAAASFNSAEVDVPQGGESLSLRFAS